MEGFCDESVRLGGAAGNQIFQFKKIFEKYRRDLAINPQNPAAAAGHETISLKCFFENTGGRAGVFAGYRFKSVPECTFVNFVNLLLIK